ncbi:hypothetical protein SNL152K_2145 [Streptomyces sp. NL15-2K]|nr:hypothetical protein SNL152K_2145 [Streptomyces sp. NL15-2K]
MTGLAPLTCRGPGRRATTRPVVRGGSHLCHASCRNRYRVAARPGNTPDSTTGHGGSRVARDSAPTGKAPA